MTTLLQMNNAIVNSNCGPLLNGTDLELGVDGASYTATETGIVYIYTGANTNNPCFTHLYNVTTGIHTQNQQISSYGNMTLFLPVSKGDEFRIYHSNIYVIDFKFFKTSGEELLK